MIFKTAKALVEEYEFHTWLVHHLLEGITHEESLMQLPFDTNSLNWTLGHIVTNRSHVLETAQVSHTWQDEVRELYHTGTPSTKPGDPAIMLETLLGYLDESTGLLKAKLETVSEEWLNESHSNYRGDKTREGHLSSFHWHEGFHIGQLEVFKDFILSTRRSNNA